MARIRSVHPGLFTDEAFVSLSDAAQIFLIGLWTEADDQGAFEWKPVTLRIRLRAGKDGSVEPILSELESANCIRPYEIDGRKLGAIRNFRRFQRPKTPNATHLINDDFRKYVGLTAVISEMTDDDGGKKEKPPPVKPLRFPPKGEKSPQMEDEGGMMKDVEHVTSSDNPEIHQRAPKRANGRDKPKTGEKPGKGRRWGEVEEVDQGWRDEVPALRKRHGLAEIDVDLAAENFARYWRSVAGAKGLKRDWHSTFINNMTDPNFRHPTPRGGRSSGLVKDQMTGELVPAIKW